MTGVVAKADAKVFLLNKVYTEAYEKNGVNVKEFRLITNNKTNSFQVVARIEGSEYKIEENGVFKTVDFEKFANHLNKRGYKAPLNQWKKEGKVLYSASDYENGVISKGSTLSLVLNELKSQLGYDVVVIDFDLASNTDEERRKIDEFVNHLSEKREILATPNGYHILISRSEYEMLLNLLNVNGLQVTSNNMNIRNVSVKFDAFKTWEGVRYILVPTKGSVREELGGGILYKGVVKKGIKPIEIIYMFDKFHSYNNEDGFIDLLVNNIGEVNGKNDFQHVVDAIVSNSGYAKTKPLKDFCREVGISNLANFDINALCRAIERVGNKDGTGRYGKILRYIFYYVSALLVKRTNSYEELLNVYENIDIYSKDDELKIYEALEKVYTDPRELAEKSRSLIKYKERTKINIVERLRKIYDAIKKHMFSTSNDNNDDEDGRRIKATSDDTFITLAKKFADLGVRRYGSEHIVYDCFYKTKDEFRAHNEYILKSISQNLCEFYHELPEPFFVVDGEYYDDFELIPRGAKYYYDAKRKSNLLFFKDKKSRIAYCIRFSEKGFDIEQVDGLNRPLFYRYYISNVDWKDLRKELDVFDIEYIQRLINDKEYAKLFFDEFVKIVFNYYVLSTLSEEYDIVLKKSVIVSLFSDYGFILHLIGQSGVGKTALASALGIIGSNGVGSSVYSLTKNADENNYMILEKMSRGLAVVLDEIPNQLDERNQRLLLSIVTTDKNDFRPKYKAKPITIRTPAKIIATSVDTVQWAVDAKRRTMIFTLANPSKRGSKPGQESVQEYHENVKNLTLAAKIAYYSIISNVKLDDEDYSLFYKVPSIPDTMKIPIFKFFKSIGYDLNKVVAAFDKNNQTFSAVSEFYTNIISTMSQSDVKEFIRNKPDIFKPMGEWYKIELHNFFRLLYSKGMIKTVQSEDYFYISNLMDASARAYNPDPSKFKETFMNLMQQKVVNGVNFKEIDEKLCDLTRSTHKVIPKLKAISYIPTSFIESFGISIIFVHESDKRVKNSIHIRFLDDKNNNDKNDSNKTHQKALFSDEQLKETIKKQKEEPRTYLEFRLGETQEEQPLDDAPSKSLYWIEEDKYYYDFSNMMHDGEQYEPEPVEDDEVPF
ncbi:MAG: hypothetical protein QXF12_03680 [Candidatus Aenigmatarchaeota archaeon]